MRENSVPLGRILGIPIGLDYSWFVIVALLSWSLATGYYPARYADWPVAQYWLLGGITTIMLFASVLLHELGHATVALAYRIPVRRIRLMIFGGVAELGGEPPKPVAELLVALAGPVVSLLLAGTFLFLHVMLRLGGVSLVPLMALFAYLANINLTLAIFNLIPGFPLDGGRVLRAILWAAKGNLFEATRVAAGVGRIVSFGFMGLGALQVFAGNLSGGLWTGFIGLFLLNAVRAELATQHLRDLLSAYTVDQLMRRHYLTIPAEATLEQLVPYYIFNRGQRSFIVERNGYVVGLLGPEHLTDVPRSAWTYTTVAEVMQPIDDLAQIAPGTGLWTAAQRMETEGLNQLLVTFEGRILGLLRREDVLNHLHNLQLWGRWGFDHGS